MRVLTWMQSNASFQAILNFERSMFSFLLLFIVLVALFAMTGALVTSVVRKTREIGLLGALGAQPRHVAAAFCVQSLVVGVCGTVFGLIFGFTMVYFREGIVTMITKFTMSREDFAHFYQFTRLPAHIEARTVILLVLFTLLASVIAGVYPAWRAARLKPAEALRSE
jgi:lipoprotein-releasing system permease protein